MEMTNKEVKKQVRNIRNAIIKLSSDWENLTDQQRTVLEEIFPFDQSFDEVARRVDNWDSFAEENLREETS